jgi:hypothetical protein
LQEHKLSGRKAHKLRPQLWKGAKFWFKKVVLEYSQ